MQKIWNMKIANNSQYKEMLHLIYKHMNKSADNMSEAEAGQIQIMAKAIEFYEDNILKLMPINEKLGIDGNFMLEAI